MVSAGDTGLTNCHYIDKLTLDSSFDSGSHQVTLDLQGPTKPPFLQPSLTNLLAVITDHSSYSYH